MVADDVREGGVAGHDLGVPRQRRSRVCKTVQIALLDRAEGPLLEKAAGMLLELRKAYVSRCVDDVAGEVVCSGAVPLDVHSLVKVADVASQALALL